MNGEREQTADDLREPMFDGIGEAAGLDPARRAALLERIVPARAEAPPSRARILHLSWGALAAAAAVIVAVVVLWPEHREPIPPTEVFAYLLGPLTEMTAAGASAGEPAPEDASPMDAVVGAFWSDLEGPLAVGMDALEAPRALAAVESAGQAASANHPPERKEN
jgi:hypothetical protein